MMQPADELRSLWADDQGGGGIDPARLLLHLQRTAHRFDRTIRFRNLREIAAGVLVAAVFLWFAWHDASALERAAHAWLAACGIWTVIFFLRLQGVGRRSAPEQTLSAYRRELFEGYDRQIRLLENAKYWYVLPFWAGLLFSAVAHFVRTGDAVTFWLLAAWATAVNALLWWLNESVGAGYVRAQLRNLEELAGSREAGE